MTVHKGLDDLLAAGLVPRRLSGGEVDEFFSEGRQRFFGSSPPVQVDTIAPILSSCQQPRLPFPVDVFPDLVRRFVQQVSQSIGCPLDFVGVAVLVVVGAAVGAARCLRIKSSWIEKPGMYAAIVASPGRHKTPAAFSP